MAQYRDPNDPIGGAMMGTPDIGLGTASPAAPTAPQNGPALGTTSAAPSLGLGATTAQNQPNYTMGNGGAGDYNKLRQDATSYYLQHGGTQQNVDAYFAARPNQDYNSLASDAAQWYASPTRQDSNTDFMVNGGPSPTQQQYSDLRNQNIGNYFGVPAPPAGQNYNFGNSPATPGTNMPNPPANGGAGDYNKLWQDATSYYLGHGGTQQNVDAYRTSHPGQNYAQLKQDAATWYRDPNRSDSTNLSGAGGRDAQVASYFGNPEVTRAAGNGNVTARQGEPGFLPGGPMDPHSGDNMIRSTDQPTAGLSGAQSPYPQSWIDTYNQQTPEVQAAIQARYGGMTPEQIMRDWEQNVQPQYAPGTSAQQILSGAPTTPPPAPTYPNAGRGSPGSVNLAAHTAGGTLQAPSAVPGSNLKTTGYQEAPPGYRGAGFVEDDVSYDPSGGRGFIWDNAGGPSTPGGPPNPSNPGGPAPSLQPAGQAQLNAQLTADGQPYTGLQGLLDYLRVSTPGSQSLKGQLEQRDSKGDSLETGEKTLFDLLAPYLIPNATQIPPNMTQFSNWDPLSLLTALLHSGIVRTGG